jgi:hypothetical protein
MKEIEWPDGGPTLLKPTASASQAKFVALAESDQELQVLLLSVWCLAAKRKAGYNRNDTVPYSDNCVFHRVI